MLRRAYRPLPKEDSGTKFKFSKIGIQIRELRLLLNNCYYFFKSQAVRSLLAQSVRRHAPCSLWNRADCIPARLISADPVPSSIVPAAPQRRRLRGIGWRPSRRRGPSHARCQALARAPQTGGRALLGRGQASSATTKGYLSLGCAAELWTRD